MKKKDGNHVRPSPEANRGIIHIIITPKEGIDYKVIEEWMEDK